MPRAGEVAEVRETIELPPSWPLLPLRDDRGFAHLSVIVVPSSPSEAKGEEGTEMVGGN